MSITTDPIGPAPAATPAVPWFVRLGRVFMAPARAFEGMSGAGQWWIPLLLLLAIESGLGLLTYHRVLVPDMVTRWEQAVTAGTMQPDQLARMEEFFAHSPAALGFTIGSVIVVVPIMFLLQALVVWFGAGFVLGAKFRYGQALAVVSWASLVGLPGSFIRYAYGWVRESFQGLHLGLGVLLPEPETPTKLLTGLTVFLDAISPFAAWYIAVLVLGVATLTGMPRRNVAWVLVTLYLAFVALSAAVAALFSPGA